MKKQLPKRTFRVVVLFICVLTCAGIGLDAGRSVWSQKVPEGAAAVGGSPVQPPPSIQPSGDVRDADGPLKSPPMIVGHSYHNDTSPPLRSMKQVPRGQDLDKKEPRERNKNPKLNLWHVDSYDPVVQSNFVANLLEPNMPNPVLNFDGISYAGGGSVGEPSDTDGEVGQTQYVQMVNDGYQVFNKSTGASLLGPSSIVSLWSGFGGVCETAGDGDPIVLYDQISNRWLISQFAGASVPTDECIAISTTNDATGAYNRYGFHLGSNFFDYPHLAVWPDGYYMSMNVFDSTGSTFLGPQAFAFDRAKMMAGQAATFITPSVALDPNADAIHPADLDGSALPPAGAPETFVAFPGNAPTYILYHFHADFTTPANSTFTTFGSPAAAGFTLLCPTTRACVPELGGGSLDGIGDRLMHRLTYRNFGDHESVVGNYTVSSNGVAGIRWFEIRSVTAGTPTVFQESTYQPDTTWRWMGSAAMDAAGNIAVGFSASSSAINPQIRYAGRLTSDPQNTLGQGETTLFAGTGSQTPGNRWGDYSALTVDPTDDCTFWYTQEYYQTTGDFNWRTRIGSFKFPSCTTGPTGTLHFAVTAAFNNSPISGATVTVDGYPSGQTAAGGTLDLVSPVGSHSYSVSKPGYVTASGNASSANGQTTNIPLSLVSTPVVAAGGPGVVTNDSCTPSNGIIDAGETVTVSFPIVNNGGIGSATTNLVATLQNTGGVTGPSGPQSYGVVTQGAPAVSRSFTFTAGTACGQTLTATLHLVDGATDYGNIAYTFQTGALGAPATASYSSGNIAVSIPDNNPAGVDIPINVSDAGAVTDVNVRVRINHTFDSDLNISLIAPDNTSIPLATARGAGGANFGTGSNDCSGNPTIFDDSAGTTIAAGVAPFSGSFRPDSPLSALNGKPSNGTWKLHVADTAAVDVGTVGCVSLDVTRQRYVCCGVGGTSQIASAGTPALTAESISPANQAVDPNESVIMDFPLIDVGDGSTSNLVATMQASGGVNPISGPITYGVLAVGGSSVTRSFQFSVTGSCGSTVTATIHLQDGSLDLGNLTYPIKIGKTVTTTQTFSNNTAIQIPAGQPTTTSGIGSPYPSNIAVAGITGTVTKVTVTLKQLSHTFPSDVDVLLVGPTGQKFIVMSDVIGGTDWTGQTYTLDDDAGALLPPAGGSPPPSGGVQPTNYNTGDTFASPAPAGPYLSAATAGVDTFASAFNGLNPNGTWSLYVVDDGSGDVGTMAGGWDLTVVTSTPSCSNPQACTVNVPANITTGATGPNGAIVKFTPPLCTGSCGVITSNPASGSLFPIGTTTVNVTSTNNFDAPSAANSFTVTVTSPTAARVGIAGRVLTPDHSGLRNAGVTLRGPDGSVRTAITSAFGYYYFSDVDAGNYTVMVTSRRFKYSPRVLSVNEELNDVDFVPQQ